MKSIANQAGLSIVELLIALLLGLFLTVGLTQLFVGSSDAFRLAESTSRMQESGRLAHEILGQAIRGADYWGCVKHGQVQSVIDTAPGSYDADHHGFDPAAGSSVDIAVATAADSAVEGSHVIRLKGAENLGISLKSAMNNASANLDVNDATGLGAGDIVLLSDCSDGVAFQITAIQGSNDKLQHNTGEQSPGNASGPCPPGGPASANCFPKAFSSGDITRLQTRQYEVRINAGRPALYEVKRFNPDDPVTATELIEGVIDMRVEVGVGPGITVTNWLDAATAGINMDNVKAMRISLLVRSTNDNIASSAQSVCFPAWADCSAGPNWAAAAGDEHLYRVYTSTYTIRNRLLEVL